MYAMPVDSPGQAPIKEFTEDELDNIYGALLYFGKEKGKALPLISAEAVSMSVIGSFWTV